MLAKVFYHGQSSLQTEWIAFIKKWLMMPVIDGLLKVVFEVDVLYRCMFLEEVFDR
jgi:hypothetical protein